MKSLLAAFAAGGLFGLGLAISGMTMPSKVAGFLDVGGAWDASLAFVMIGAIGVHFIAHRLVRKRPAPLFETSFTLPARKDIDRRLVIGGLLFGVGWGLGGFCPGPGIVSAGAGSTAAIVFVVGMTAGMLAEHGSRRLLGQGASPPTIAPRGPS